MRFAIVFGLLMVASAIEPTIFLGAVQEDFDFLMWVLVVLAVIDVTEFLVGVSKS